MFDEMSRKLEEALRIIRQDMQSIKTGRAKPSMVEQVMVEAYEGTRMPLVELASISAPDTTMLVIQPWDHGVLKKIQAGLAASELQLNPVVDGNMIRISIPPLTEERRLEMVKLVKQKVESGKEMMRGIRNEMKKEIDAKEGEAGVSEDDLRQWIGEMQKLFDAYVDKLELLGRQKEEELMLL
jgi:ribosome recycling factor